MQLLFRSSHYAQDNRSVFVGTVRACLLEIMREIVSGMRRHEIKFDGPETIECVMRLREAAMATPAHAAGGELAADIAKLRADSGVQRALERSRELHLAESSRYFLDASERLFAPDYQPDDNDLLQLRLRTTGVTRFQVGDARAACPTAHTHAVCSAAHCGLPSAHVLSTCSPQVEASQRLLEVFDMGGLRCERRKWLTRLRTVHAIYYVA